MAGVFKMAVFKRGKKWLYSLPGLDDKFNKSNYPGLFGLTQK